MWKMDEDWVSWLLSNGCNGRGHQDNTPASERRHRQLKKEIAKQTTTVLIWLFERTGSGKALEVNACECGWQKSFTCLRSLETRSRHIDGILKRKDIQDSKHPDLRLPVLLPMDQRLKAGEHWGSQEECGNASGSCQNLWGSLNSKLISLFGHVWTCLVPKISVTVENLG